MALCPQIDSVCLWRSVLKLTVCAYGALSSNCVVNENVMFESNEFPSILWSKRKASYGKHSLPKMVWGTVFGGGHYLRDTRPMSITSLLYM